MLLLSFPLFTCIFSPKLHSINPPSDFLVFDPKTKILGLYVFVGAIVGLFLTLAYIFEGIFEGDKEGIKAAATAAQVFMEGVAFSDRFSIPIRVFVPVFYNSRRIFTHVDWLWNEITKVEQDYEGSTRRLHIGRALAVANLAFWCLFTSVEPSRSTPLD